MKSHATYAGDPRHHHTDLAELRAEVERLRAEVERLKAALVARGVHPNTADAIAHGVPTFGDLR